MHQSAVQNTTASYLGGMHRAQVCSGTTRRALVEKVWVHRCQVNRGSGPQFHSLHHHYSRSMHHLQVLPGHSQRERCNMTTHSNLPNLKLFFLISGNMKVTYILFMLKYELFHSLPSIETRTSTSLNVALGCEKLCQHSQLKTDQLH